MLAATASHAALPWHGAERGQVGVGKTRSRGVAAPVPSGGSRRNRASRVDVRRARTTLLLLMALAGTLRVALIGSGFIAEVHLLALRAIPGVEVVALCDTVLARAERLARRHRVPRVFGSVAELLDARV